MSCNCNNGDTPEYYITLDGVGVDGYSPEINIINEDTKSFELELINKSNTQNTPAIPKLAYLEGTYVSNSSLASTLSNYSTSAQIASTYLTITDAVNTYFTKADALNKLNTNGSNALNPITINGTSIQSIGTGTRIGSTTGQLTLQGSTTRPAYLQIGGSSKSLALLTDVPDITTKLNTDGSNATSNIAINGIKFINQDGYNNNIIQAGDTNNLSIYNGGSLVNHNQASIFLTSNGNAQINANNNVNLSASNDIHLKATNGKVYYGSITDASKEIATVGDIGDGTITITQGGVTKGTFTLNQSGNATIALDAGGSASTNPIVLTTTDESRSLTLGLNNDTKKAYMTYDITGGLSFVINLIGGKTAPIILTEQGSGTYSVGLDYNTNTLGLDTNNKLTVVGAETNFDITKEDNSVTYTYTNGFDASNKYYEQVVQDDGNSTTTTDIISKYNFNGSNGIDISVSSSTTDGTFANIRTYNISNNIDNSTIKVNGNGQLYCDVSNLANKDLDNLSTDGEERLHALKGYSDEGEVLTDPGGLADVIKYAHSTFDSAKFTAVGSPTVTTNGIASGFSYNDYLTISNSGTLDKTTYFYVHVVFTTPLAWGTTGGRFWSHGSQNFVGHTTAGKLSGSFLGTGISNSNLSALTLNTKYEAFFIYDESGWYVTYREFGGTTWTSSTPVEVTSETTLSLTTQQIGKEVGASYPFLGSIDLKYFEFNADSIKFRGNKTGTDTLTSGGSTITIPYTLASTGDKIVDVYYRDDVEDLYERDGSALYWTLDEVNGNYTLPQGNVYGFLTQLQSVVTDLQSRLTALETNINGGGAGATQMLSMSPLSLRPTLSINRNQNLDIDPDSINSREGGQDE